MKKLLVAALLALAGCGTGPAAGQSGHDYRLLVEKLGGAEVSIVTTSSATSISLPGGFLTADGSQLFSSGGQVFGGSAGPLGTTVMNVYDARSGALARKLEVAGAWSWDGAGTSPDGRWVVLTGRSGFVVLDTTSGRQYPVGLDSRFSFDAISNDGKSLYLIQSLDDYSYQVRRYHVFSNSLDTGAISIKGPEVEVAMSGYKITAVADPNGQMLYSLYGRHDGRPPFVHALDLDNAIAYCIDLPAVVNGNYYLDAGASGWALSLDANRHTLYASSSRGQVAAINTTKYAVARSAALTAPAPTSLLPSLLVEGAAKEFEGLPAASAVDPSGRWLSCPSTPRPCARPPSATAATA